MAKLTPFSADNVIGDLEANINRDYNQLIRKVLRRLATKKRSPVWTGFFASSWDAKGVPIQAKDDVENYEPWKTIKRRINNVSPNRQRAMANSLGKIEPRFKPKNRFSINRTVYIGNHAQHAIYALEGGKIQYFFQSELGQLIRDTMRDKGTIYATDRVGIGSFGKLAGDKYIKYTEY